MKVASDCQDAAPNGHQPYLTRDHLFSFCDLEYVGYKDCINLEYSRPNNDCISHRFLEHLAMLHGSKDSAAGRSTLSLVNAAAGYASTCKNYLSRYWSPNTWTCILHAQYDLDHHAAGPAVLS